MMFFVVTLLLNSVLMVSLCVSTCSDAQDTARQYRDARETLKSFKYNNLTFSVLVSLWK